MWVLDAGGVRARRWNFIAVLWVKWCIVSPNRLIAIDRRRSAIGLNLDLGYLCRP
jgi:hypothetical protein